MVDEKRIAFTPAVEISYLQLEEQNILLSEIEYSDCTPNISQAQQLKALSMQGLFKKEHLSDIMSEEKANQKERVKIPVELIRKYFPKDYTTTQMEEEITALNSDFKSGKKLREADKNLKHFIQDDVKGLTDELSETGKLLRKLENSRQSQMYAVKNIEEIKERLLSFEKYETDAQPDVLVNLIQFFVERIYIVDENDERYCHIKGCTKENNDEFFRTTGYVSGARETGTITSALPVCDLDKCCKCTIFSVVY